MWPSSIGIIDLDGEDGDILVAPKMVKREVLLRCIMWLANGRAGMQKTWKRRAAGQIYIDLPISSYFCQGLHFPRNF